MEKILRRIPGAINQIRIPSGFATKTYSEFFAEHLGQGTLKEYPKVPKEFHK